MKTPEEFREFARGMGGAFYECDPVDPRWSWSEEPWTVVDVIDRPMVDGAMSRQAWSEWLAEEATYEERGGHEAVEAMAAALRSTPEAFEPVIVAVHPDGRVEIGDGWHRFAIAVRDGLPVLTAVVGRMLPHTTNP